MTIIGNKIGRCMDFLYYMQGLNTTPVHGHTALFGVYGRSIAHYP